jgi:phosphoribosylaminoimidazole-succinocarboxamide synthase
MICLFGELSGSAWAEYNKPETLHHVHGIKLPGGLKESEKLPEPLFPLFTPSTKAEQGSHDQNISPDTGQFTF